MKNIAKLILPALSAAALISCGSTATGVANTNNDAVSNATVTNASTHELFAFEAATGLPLIAELGASSSATALMAPQPLGAVSDDTLLNNIKGYLPSVESALLGGEELITAVSETSDKSEYANKIVVSYTDLALEKASFTMYFNETALVDDDDDDDDWDDKYENDQEVETRIDGIVTFGENTYTIWGEKEIENDESEVKFVYKMSDTTYVQIQQEKETGESEFEYTVYENGSKVYDYSLEVENNQVELKVKDKAALTSLKMEFTLFVKDNVTYIKAEVKDGTTSYEILFQKVVDATTGEASYSVISNQ